MADCLVDASFLIALSYLRDVNHTAAVRFAAQTKARLLFPDVVLPEVAYNLQRLGGVPAVVRFGDTFARKSPPLISLTASDFSRAIAVMRTYMAAELDFVDCCLTALSERLNIEQICTFDRRDFSIIRPKHVAYFDLAP